MDRWPELMQRVTLRSQSAVYFYRCSLGKEWKTWEDLEDMVEDIGICVEDVEDV